jgi:hypothetical protein
MKPYFRRGKKWKWKFGKKRRKNFFGAEQLQISAEQGDQIGRVFSF